MPIKDYINSKKAIGQFEKWLKENNKQTGKNYAADNISSVSETVPDVKYDYKEAKFGGNYRKVWQFGA